jgi:glycosyltransferase involved in cell wall biosynthesis
MRKKEKINISVIIPVYNEEENIRSLYLELKEVFRSTNRSYEIIFINDASRDRTLEGLRKIAAKDKNVVVIDFVRNFGQTAALSAGIDYSSGEIIIPMDGDGQNDPADIPKLVAKIDEGYAVVSGWRKNRKDAFIRVLPSQIANWLIKKMTGVKIHDNGCALKAYRREVIDGIQLYGEMHRFVSVYASWSGGKIAEVVVNHRPRTKGKSKYGFSRIFKVILDLLVIRFLYKYISRPVHFFGKYGFWAIFVSLICALWALYLKYFEGLSINRTPLPVFSSMFLIVGVQLILTGVLAELLTRTYFESQNRKAYKIRDIINGKK